MGTLRLETAGSHLVSELPLARADDDARAVLASLAGRSFASVDRVYLVDAQGRLEGVVPTTRLLVSAGSRRAGELAERDPPTVHPDTDQERVASLAVHHRVTAMPVVDERRRLLGAVPAEALLSILRREHVEDLHRLAGIRRETSRARHALEEPPVRRVYDRLPWLLLGIVGSAVATFVMSRFERQLEARLALAYFVPGIVYLADAIGTQTEAVAVRGLSLSHAPLRTLLGRELRTGLLMGAILGALALGGVVLGFGDAMLAVTVALAVLVAGTLAASIGLVLPWALQRLGVDPAFGSGPMATVVQDVLSLLVYFSLGIWLLG